jgi:hypothetical protein
MRTTSRILGVVSHAALAWTAILYVAPASAATPQPVSPGSKTAGALTEARCPTFSWAGVPGARGYELAVFRVAEGSVDEPLLVTKVSLAGDVRSFTPPVGQCLECGGRYAWSVAAASPPDRIAWAPPLLFEVQAAPSVDESRRVRRAGQARDGEVPPAQQPVAPRAAETERAHRGPRSSVATARTEALDLYSMAAR